MPHFITPDGKKYELAEDVQLKEVEDIPPIPPSPTVPFECFVVNADTGMALGGTTSGDDEGIVIVADATGVKGWALECIPDDGVDVDYVYFVWPGGDQTERVAPYYSFGDTADEIGGSEDFSDWEFVVTLVEQNGTFHSTTVSVSFVNVTPPDPDPDPDPEVWLPIYNHSLEIGKRVYSPRSLEGHTNPVPIRPVAAENFFPGERGTIDRYLVMGRAPWTDNRLRAEFAHIFSEDMRDGTTYSLKTQIGIAKAEDLKFADQVDSVSVIQLHARDSVGSAPPMNFKVYAAEDGKPDRHFGVIVRFLRNGRTRSQTQKFDVVLEPGKLVDVRLELSLGDQGFLNVFLDGEQHWDYEGPFGFRGSRPYGKSGQYWSKATRSPENMQTFRREIEPSIIYVRPCVWSKRIV